MRDIEFRAWDKVTKHYWHLNLSNMVFEYSKTGNGRHILRLSAIEAFNNSDRFVIEQYTGLKDKHCIKIFEGDLVKYTSDDDAFFISEVKYFIQDEYPAFDITPPDEDWDFPSNSLQTGIFENCIEVIGNIHENPNLLGEEK